MSNETDNECAIPQPDGWRCIRNDGHEGPCAPSRTAPPFDAAPIGAIPRPGWMPPGKRVLLTIHPPINMDLNTKLMAAIAKAYPKGSVHIHGTGKELFICVPKS